MNPANMLIPPAMAVIRATTLRPIMRATSDPEACQNRLLADIIRDNRETGFGRAHGFGGLVLIRLRGFGGVDAGAALFGVGNWVTALQVASPSLKAVR